MYHKARILVGLIIIIMISFAGLAWGQDLKARMRARLPVINDLKARSVVGEDNQGYLVMLKGQTEKKDMVAAENQDRRKVYRAIARQQGTTDDLVGKRRAIQIAKKARPGRWLQNPKGQWYQKK